MLLVTVRIVEHLYLTGRDWTGESGGLLALSVWPQSHPATCDSKERTVIIAWKRETSGMRDNSIDKYISMDNEVGPVA